MKSNADEQKDLKVVQLNNGKRYVNKTILFMAGFGGKKSDLVKHLTEQSTAL